MSDKKTIQVNLDLFNIPGKTRKKKDPAEKKDIKIKNSQQNKTTKNKLLKYIREQQEKNYAQLFDSSSSTSSSLVKPTTPAPPILANSSSDFEKSIAYMKTVEEENKKKENQTPPSIHNTTIKHHRPHHIVSNNTYTSANNISGANNGGKITIHNTPVLLNSYPNILDTLSPPLSSEHVHIRERSASSIPPPKYGCLKNGNLPTYRSMLQQTMKKDPVIGSNIIIGGAGLQSASASPVSPVSQGPGITNSVPQPMNTVLNTRVPDTARTEQLKMISELNQLQTRMQAAKQNTGAPKNLKYLKRKKTLRRTYNVGKSKVHPNVSVLVSNRTIRKKISTQAQQLKKIPIEEIRKYLTQKGLIKVGSIAPNDVLRQMYENTVLIGGDIQNHNPENLLYNYLNSPGDPH